MQILSSEFRNRAFWLQENRRYSQTYFRLEKCAGIVNEWCQGKENCDLLDVGCGPATLRTLLRPNIRYCGIDIALQAHADYLRELNLAESEIALDGRMFDVIVAAGVFEYMGGLQNKKMAEISGILKPGGLFVTTYSNFGHIHDRLIDHSLYNNVKPLADFRHDLERCFRVLKCFPSSHNWYCSEPRRTFLKAVQMPVRVSIPVFSRLFAVNFFFLCSRT